MRVPIGARALGLAHNDPLRGPVALATLSELVCAPGDADGAGVATVVDGAALLSHQKLDAGHRALSAIVGVPQGRVAVAQVTTPRDLRPGSGQAQAGPFRARTYAAAVVGGPTDADEAAASRARLIADLPDALRRCLVGQSEGEAFFLAVLAALHKKGLLDRPHDNGQALCGAVDAVLAATRGSPRHITITNGVEVLHVARGLPSAVVVVRGLSDDVAGDVSPILADSSTARERNRRYVGAFCIGALDGPLHSSVVVPNGCTLQVFGDGGAVLVGRDLTPKQL